MPGCRCLVVNDGGCLVKPYGVQSITRSSVPAAVAVVGRLMRPCQTASLILQLMRHAKKKKKKKSQVEIMTLLILSAASRQPCSSLGSLGQATAPRHLTWPWEANVHMRTGRNGAEGQLVDVVSTSRRPLVSTPCHLASALPSGPSMSFYTCTLNRLLPWCLFLHLSRHPSTLDTMREHRPCLRLCAITCASIQ